MFDPLCGLLIAVATVVLFLRLKNINSVNDFRSLRSPTRIWLIILSNFAWLLMIPGTWWYYAFRLQRGDYPLNADSVGIPIDAQTNTILMAIAPLNIFLVMTTIGAELPARIFSSWEKPRGIVWVWELFFGFWILLNLVLLACFVMDGDHVSIIVNLFFTYVLLCLRSGQLNRRKTEILT